MRFLFLHLLALLALLGLEGILFLKMWEELFCLCLCTRCSSPLRSWGWLEVSGEFTRRIFSFFHFFHETDNLKVRWYFISKYKFILKEKTKNDVMDMSLRNLNVWRAWIIQSLKHNKTRSILLQFHFSLKWRANTVAVYKNLESDRQMVRHVRVLPHALRCFECQQNPRV